MKKKGCVDTGGFCKGKYDCCIPVAQSAITGKPICQCVRQSPKASCPKCLDLTGNGECVDQNKVCTEKGGCCDLVKLNVPAGPFNLVKFWPICTCRQGTENKPCQNCVFNKKTATCEDLKDECRKKGKCCRIKANSVSPLTGIPACECV